MRAFAAAAGLVSGGSSSAFRRRAFRCMAILLYTASTALWGADDDANRVSPGGASSPAEVSAATDHRGERDDIASNYVSPDAGGVPAEFPTRILSGLATGAVGILLLLTGFGAAWVYFRRRQGKADMLLRNLPLRVFIFDRDGRILHSHVPDPTPDIIAEPLARLEQIGPASALAASREALRRAFDDGKKVNVDLEVDGQFRHDEYLRLSADNPFHTEAVMCISGNMTELHEEHRETNRLAERFRLTLESIGDGVITTDCDGNVTLLNPVAANLTGYTQDEAVGRKLTEIFNIVSYIDQKPVASPLETALSSGQTVNMANHTDLISRDNRRYHIADCASPIRDEAGNITGGVLVFRDVTDEYQKRDRLRMNSVILKTVEEIANIGYFRCSDTGKVRFAALNEYWPLRDGEPIPPAEWIDRKYLVEFNAEWRKLLAGEIDEIEVTYSADDSKRYFELRAVKSIDDISGEREYFGVIQDITRSRESDRKNRDSFALLKNIMDNLPGYIFVKNVEDNFRYLMCNRRFGEIIGIDSSQIPGSFDQDLFPMDKEGPGKFFANDRAVIDSGSKLSTREHFVNAVGQQVVAQTVKSCLSQSDGSRLLIGMGVDVTQQYQLEKERETLLDNLRLYGKQEQLLNSILEKVTLRVDDDEALQEILHAIIVHIGAMTSFIFHTDFEHGSDVPVAEYWATEHHKTAIPTLPIDSEALWFKQVLNHEIFEVPETGTEEAGRIQGQWAQYMSGFGVGALFGIGIWVDKKFWGYLGFSYPNARGYLTQQEKFLLSSAAHMAEIILERRKSRAEFDLSENQKRLIIDSIKIPMLLLDLDLKPVRVNNATLNLTGISEDEIGSLSVSRILCNQPELPPDHPVLLCCADLQERSMHIKLHEKDYMLNVSPLIAAGKLINLLVTLVEFTDLYRQKEQLKEMMEQAQAADRAKSYFLATMSHELRTPLNAVLGFSELLQYENADRDEQLKYLQAINCAGTALLNLINDVLDLSKLEAEQVSIAPVRTDLIQLLEEMISVFQLKAKQKNLFLKLENAGIQYPVYVDQLRVRQVLLNLVGNALKFTHSGGVTIRIWFTPSAPDNTGELYIQVADTGIGVSKEQLNKIFDPFFQVENTRGNRIYEGSGLGLAISMRLAQRMGGVIEANSDPGKGSSFTVRLKNVQYAPAPPAPVHAGKSRKSLPLPTRQRVLLVDDVPMNLKVLKAMLRKINIESVCVESGAGALAILQNDQGFRCMLTDLWMPGMNGEQLTDAARAIPGIGDMRIVAVTADTEAKSNFSMKKFDAVLSKPVTIDSLQKVFLHLESLK